MSTFTKGAIATITAAALAAGICTPASAAPADTTFSTEFTGDTCTVTMNNGEDSETTEYTKEEAQKTADETAYYAGESQAEVKWLEALLEYQKKQKASEEDLKDTQENLDQARGNVSYYSRHHFAMKACAAGKSASEDSVNAQALLSSADDKGLTPAGIGVVVAGVVVVLGAVVAALPMIKPMLPPEIAALLP